MSDKYEGPPDLEGKTLDFSKFHDLMHPIWDRDCGRMPGGRRLHLRYWWDFKGEPKLKAWTLCRLGKHSDYGQAYQGGMTWKACSWCGKALSERQPI